VETAPSAIIFSSRIRRVNAFHPRRNRKAVSGMGFPLLKHVRGAVRWAPAAVVLGAAVQMGLAGLERSFWLDEAWVVNSLRTSSFAEMVRGGDWLQTSPPGFLLAARGAVAAFGWSKAALRSVPLVFTVLAGVAVLGAARRLAPAAAPLTAAALLFPMVAVEYLHAFKQYAGEAAAAAVVLWAAVEYELQPDGRRFAALWLAAVGLLGLAYPLAFLAPGLLVLVWRRGGWRRAAALALGMAAMLAALYAGSIRPNVGASLWSYWDASWLGAYSAGVWLWLAAAAALTAWGWRQRRYAVVAGALPVLMLAAAEWNGWYPASPRTRLFARPGFLLAAAAVAGPWLARLRWSQPVAAAGAMALAVNAAATYRPQSFEAYDEAVELLRARVALEDLLLVHASAREGFRLHAALKGWEPPARYGDTGWPCCPRGKAFARGRAEAAAVRADLARLAPAGFRGRIWMLYTDRPTHWDFLGLDEGELWRSTLWERGCPPEGYIKLPNLIVAVNRCHSP
jgi:hypothetical protein